MRKINQIIESSHGLVALCVDGTLWNLSYGNKEWVQLEGIPDQPKCVNDLEMELPKKAIANLEKAGIHSIEALVGLTKSEVSTIPGLGPKMIFDIESELKNLGLRFRRDIESDSIKA